MHAHVQCAATEFLKNHDMNFAAFALCAAVATAPPAPPAPSLINLFTELDSRLPTGYYRGTLVCHGIGKV